MNNLEKYKKDLEELIKAGENLYYAMIYENQEEQFEKSVREALGGNAKNFLNKLPSFSDDYQSWYSEAKVLVRQLLPDRMEDFVSYYEVPRSRKDIKYSNYKIYDYLSSIEITSGLQKIVDPSAAIPRFKQQLEIVKSIQKKFESSLFDIVQIVQADLFDSELEAARVLVKHGFLRAGGAMAGVVMERHLAQVCKNHKITIRKKDPTISYFNDKLKNEGVIDIPEWRFNQHLADIRNLCSHNKDQEPTKEQVTELIDGVAKLTKTIF